MKITKIFIVSILLITACMAQSIICSAYSAEEFNVKNLNVPADYVACTKNQCDPELEAIILQNGFTSLADWVTRVMEPQGMYLYSCNKNDLTKCMYLLCKKNKLSKTKDGLVEHELAGDYNMYKTESDKAELLDAVKRAAATGNAIWAPYAGKTPFVEYNATDGTNFIHAYRTIYGGNEITIQFSSAKAFTEDEINTHLSILSSMEYVQDVDYAEIDKKISDARTKKLEEETHSGENTKTLRYIISASVAFVIFFSVYLAIRSQKKKRRSSVIVVDDTNNED